MYTYARSRASRAAQTHGHVTIGECEYISACEIKTNSCKSESEYVCMYDYHIAISIKTLAPFERV